jgi:saccharopine dehydrogenase-like NADP-dependent oxidoreductase
MAITVGTPLAIATKFVATGEFNKAGIHIPVTPDLYNPILDELAEYNISFEEKETEI